MTECCDIICIQVLGTGFLPVMAGANSHLGSKEELAFIFKHVSCQCGSSMADTWSIISQQLEDLTCLQQRLGGMRQTRGMQLKYLGPG